MTERIIVEDELAEQQSYNAAEAETLIPNDNQLARRRFWPWQFRFALGYLRFKAFTKEKVRQNR